MISTIEDITARIVESYDPDRIILFGSRAAGSYTEESDVDLLILKETTDRPLDRRIAVERLFMDRLLPIDLFVYTPTEVRYLYSMGSPFIEDIMETGRLLYMKKPAQSWFEDARDECESAGILLDHEKFRASCYHSQQCVEKGLNALIIERGKKPDRIHDIIGLLNTLRDLGLNADLASEDAVFLNSVYKGRYPTEEGLLPYGDPKQDDAKKAYEAAARFFESVRVHLQKEIP